MMPTIRVDDEVWGWLKSQAQPFEDTPNSVLRRVAGLNPAVPPAGQSAPGMRRVGRRPSGAKTAQSEFRLPILRILARHGGRGDRAHVLAELERMMAGRLTELDRSDIQSGTIRWQKSAEWEVSTMRQEGLLLPRDKSPRGVWCLTPKGQDLAAS
jgi:Mrr restriction endonuclease-like protein